MEAFDVIFHHVDGAGVVNIIMKKQKRVKCDYTTQVRASVKALEALWDLMTARSCPVEEQKRFCYMRRVSAAIMCPSGSGLRWICFADAMSLLARGLLAMTTFRLQTDWIFHWHTEQESVRHGELLTWSCAKVTIRVLSTWLWCDALLKHCLQSTLLI